MGWLGALFGGGAGAGAGAAGAAGGTAAATGAVTTAGTAAASQAAAAGAMNPALWEAVGSGGGIMESIASAASTVPMTSASGATAYVPEFASAAANSASSWRETYDKLEDYMRLGNAGVGIASKVVGTMMGGKSAPSQVSYPRSGGVPIGNVKNVGLSLIESVIQQRLAAGMGGRRR